MKIKPRDYQERAVEETRIGFRVAQAILYALATGGGKTYTFCLIAYLSAQKGKRVMIIVHRKELLLQASASLRNLGIDHGMISPHFTPSPHKLVQVASVDTLIQRLKKRTYHVDLLIMDEAHHVVADNKWGRVYELLDKPKMLGVTATPVRTDGKGLGLHAGGLFEKLILGPSITELIERGMLINPKVYGSQEIPDLKGLRKDKDGDYSRAALADRVDKPRITGSAVEHYTRICPGAKAIVFCSSVKHAKHVRDEFNAAGYKFELLVGAPEMSDAERTAINRKLRRGEIHGACTVDLVSEGYDLPDLECCIMLRPTASESLFLQQVGRIMRPSETKRGCWLLDHVGNVGIMVDGVFKAKHGFPDQEREWTLDGRKKRKSKKNEEPEETIDLKQCPKCYLVHAPSPTCPACGHVYETKERKIEQVDGELKEITQEMRDQIALDNKRKQGAARSVDEMVRQLGYSRTRAEKIVQAREEKEAMQSALIADLQAWREETGQTALEILGVPMMGIKSMKPKALRELREKFEAHQAACRSGEISMSGTAALF